MSSRFPALLTSLVAIFGLTSCTGSHVSSPVVVHANLQGRAMGGQQPITGATIHLYQVGTGGAGSQASDLLTITVTTSDGSGVSNANANAGNNNNQMQAGFFTLTGDYTCPSSDTLVYLAGVGGDPGSGENDSQSSLVALGNCGDLKATTFININEVTTVGTVAALYPYMHGYDSIGSDPGDAGLVSAFTKAAMYMDSATGTSPGPQAAGYLVPSNDVRALANVVQRCVNSTGDTGSGACRDFFTYVSYNYSYPTDTVGALVNLFLDYSTNVTEIFNLQTPQQAFTPTNNTPPADWSLPIYPIPGPPVFSPVAGTYPSTQVMTISDSDPTAVIHYTTDGSAPTAASAIYSGGFYLTSSATVKALAIESNTVSSDVSLAAYTIDVVQAAAPSISPAGGTFASPQTVSLSSTTPLAHYYYTTDGSDPTTASTQYNAPFTVSTTEILKAVAYSNGYGPSAVSSASFVFQAPSPNIITTIVGSGSRNYYGDGVYALDAQLYQPKSVAVDASGNVYIGDWGNGRIRKVDANSGIMTTIAGTGAAGPVGDNGLAVNASLGTLNGLSIYAGNLYVGDNGHSSIRKIDLSTGIITTVFGGGGSTTSESDGNNGDGGPAISVTAKARSIGGTVLDANGNIFFSDSNGHRVRVVYNGGSAVANLLVLEGIATPVVGNVYTLAGNGARTLANNFADSWAGDGGLAVNATLYYPAGICLDPSGNIVFGDTLNGHVRKISLSTGIISNVAGGDIKQGGWDGDGSSATASNVRLSNPFDVAYDAGGNLLIAGGSTNVIRKVNTSGIISTIAGTPVVAAYGGDGGPATSALLNSPQGLALVADGSYFIADSGNNRIRKVDATGKISTIAGSGAEEWSAGIGGNALQAELYGGVAVAADASNNLYIADVGYGNVFKVTASSGYITHIAGTGSTSGGGGNGPALTIRLINPRGIAVDPAGNVYVSDQAVNGGVIRRIDTAGNETIVAGNGVSSTGTFPDGIAATSAQIGAIYGVHTDSAGNFYFADNNYGCIRKVTVATGLINTVVGNCSFHPSQSFAGDNVPSPTGVEFNQVKDFFLTAAGDIYISDTYNQRVRLVYNGGTAAANLLIAQGRTPVVGYIYTIAGNGTLGSAGDGSMATSAGVALAYPTGIAVDSSGNVFFSTTTNGNTPGNERVRRIDVATGKISSYVSSTGVSGFAGDGGPAAGAQLFYPNGLTIDANGDLIIADANNRRIRKVSH